MPSLPKKRELARDNRLTGYLLAFLLVIGRLFFDLLGAGLEGDSLEVIVSGALLLKAYLRQSRAMSGEDQKSILKTFRIEKGTVEDLSRFLQGHPEVASLNHLVNVALKEFVSIHKDDSTWLKN